jgi:hypothetical protein
VTPHTTRVRIYHTVSFGVTVMISAGAILTDGFGGNKGMFCLVDGGSIVGQIFFAIVISCLISAWTLSILAINKLNKLDSNLTKRYLVIVLVSIVLITISFALGLTISFSSNSRLIWACSMPFTTAVGLTFGIGRLYNRALLRAILLKACKRKTLFFRNSKSIKLKSSGSGILLSESIISINEEPISLNQYFETESAKYLLRIFTTLSLRFSESVKNLEAYRNYNEYYFEEEHFLSALGSLSVDTFHNRTLYLVYDPNLTIKEIQPNIFKKIREASNITDQSLSG